MLLSSVSLLANPVEVPPAPSAVRRGGVPDARPSTRVYAQDQPLCWARCPCVVIPPSGDPTCVFFHGTASLAISLCLSLAEISLPSLLRSDLNPGGLSLPQGFPYVALPYGQSICVISTCYLLCAGCGSTAFTLRKMGISGTALQRFKSYLSDRSFRVSWRGEVSKSQQLATGVPQGSVLGPLLFSIYMTSLGSVIQKHGFSYYCYDDDTQLYFSFQPDDPTVFAHISACLSDISSWMNDHHLQLNLTKTELLVVPANPSFHHNFSIQLGSSTMTPSRTARNLGVVMDHQLSFTDDIATMTRSCRFALYNIRKIRPFLSEQATQLLVQALVLSRLDYCNALLAGLPACTIKPLQLIQNAAARVVFNESKTAHVTPLLIRLRWLPVAARIKFKVLMLAYKTTTGTAPTYQRSLVQ
uniref:Reverse transcriptase domain-containing protein n=1 Tax=Cyprinus carpio TaxID=7962 RepID=A0A8C1ZWJ4_CYPCA